MESEFILVELTKERICMVRKSAINYVLKRGEQSTVVFGKGDGMAVSEGFESLKQKLMGDWIDDVKKGVRKPRTGFTI